MYAYAWHIKGRPKAGILVSAETESNTESKIWPSTETEITPKVTRNFRPKAETESACRATAVGYMSVDFSVDCSSCFSFTAWTDKYTHRHTDATYRYTHACGYHRLG